MHVRFLLASLILCLLGLTGCGSVHSPLNVATPTGPFSNASLSGTYALSLAGTNTGGFFSIIGSLQLNGAGTVTGGVVDVNTASGVFTNQSVSGTYTIRSNGQALATLTTPAGNFNLAFAVVSSQRALVMRFDTSATASGSLDRQDATAFSNATLNGNFAFNISGVDAGGFAMQSAGALAADGAGTVTSGVEDVNDNGVVSTNLALSGGYTLNTANGRGTVSLTTTAGTLNFVFHIVDANRLKVLETDTVPVLAGDAFRQTGPFSNASVSGPLVFTTGGQRGNFAYALGGVLTADGGGNITAGLQDLNNGGTVTQGISTTGTYSIAANGRGTMTLNGSGTSNYAIYPSTGGLQMIEIDLALVNGGAAFNQQATTFSTGSLQGPFSFNLTGATLNGEVDSIAQFTMDGAGKLSGALDVNNVGSLASSLALAGNYSMASSGRGTLQFLSSAGTQAFVIYAVSNTRLLFIEIDPSLVGVGVFEHQ